MTVISSLSAIDNLYGAGAKSFRQTHAGSAAILAQDAVSPLVKYRLIKKIGAGSFSTVHHAIHMPTNRDVALKAVDKKLSSLDTVATEIAAMRRLQGHPHIVQLYDVFEDDQFVYMALEYCPNGNLHDYLVSKGRLSEEHARVWFHQLLRAVMFCQQQGVISRDVKNSNIVIDAHGNIKLADFGLSVLINNCFSDYIGHSAGSAVFAAPEVYNAKRRPYAPIPADVWAVGAVLHSMVKRVLPFPHLEYAKHWSKYTAPDHVSQECQELLRSIFNLNPMLRPTPSEILYHPWITGSPASRKGLTLMNSPSSSMSAIPVPSYTGSTPLVCSPVASVSSAAGSTSPATVGA